MRVPLIEIVSEPDIRNAIELVHMEKVHQILTFIGVCDGDLEKGHFVVTLIFQSDL